MTTSAKLVDQTSSPDAGAAGLVQGSLDPLRYEGHTLDPDEVTGIVVSMIPRGARVLDVGCGSGEIGQLVHDNCGSQVIGVEPDSYRAERSRQHGLAVVESHLTRELIKELGSFDIVLLADVLEHLPNPQAMLLLCREALKPGGAIIVSVPNVAHWSVRVSLLRGTFRYDTSGIMDATHLRWFTAQSIKSLVGSAGFAVTDYRATAGTTVGDNIRPPLSWLPRTYRSRFLRSASRRWPTLFGAQHVLKAEVSKSLPRSLDLMPKVSIIIPNYNHARFLRQRIESVLGQTYRNFEVIVLDDCSTDDSHSILSEYASDPRVRIEFNEKNSGSTFKQWNKGISLARGEYIWVAESDDYADERLLERLVQALHTQPEVTFAYCRSWRISQGKPNGYADDYLDFLDGRHWKADFVVDGREECRKYFIWCNPVPNASAVLFRKAVYERVGKADENLRLCGDWKLWAAMALEGKIAYIAEPLNYFRFHDASLRNWNQLTGSFSAEHDEVSLWVQDEAVIADRWVPLLLSLHVPFRAKREIFRKAWAFDPHPIRNAIRPALLTLRLKFLRHWRELRPAAGNDRGLTPK